MVMGMAGVVVIFLSHVRSALVVLLGRAVVYAIVMARQGRLKTILSVCLLMAVGGVCSIYFRRSTRRQKHHGSVRHAASGQSRESVFEKTGHMGMVIGAFDTFLFEHPLGAGLGRWGMMRIYFGDENNVDSPAIWSEVQFSSWILDGGIVLLVVFI